MRKCFGLEDEHTKEVSRQSGSSKNEECKSEEEIWSELFIGANGGVNKL